MCHFIINFRIFENPVVSSFYPTAIDYSRYARNIQNFLFRINLLFSDLLSMTVTGEPTVDDEEGGYPDEEQEALVEEQEEESRRLPGPRWCHG